MLAPPYIVLECLLIKLLSFCQGALLQHAGGFFESRIESTKSLKNVTVVTSARPHVAPGKLDSSVILVYSVLDVR